MVFLTDTAPGQEPPRHKGFISDPVRAMQPRFLRSFVVKVKIHDVKAGVFSSPFVQHVNPECVRSRTYVKTIVGICCFNDNLCI